MAWKSSCPSPNGLWFLTPARKSRKTLRKRSSKTLGSSRRIWGRLTMLEVKKISVSYLGVPVIREVSFKVEKGQMVSIVGSNGAGKSTILTTISGLLRPLTGEISFQGQRIDTLPPFQITALGLSHIPEGRKIFSKLTVMDNLLVGAHPRRSNLEVQQSLGEIYQLFPILDERKNQRGETLSGGEQQMLAIARGLMSKPKLMMHAEPWLGLLPSLSVK